jgi:Sap, sulfolipid-1-addressing protein
MISVDIELALVGLVAMLEPATLISSALALALGERPLRTGAWFFLGGVGATLAVGVLAAFVLGNAAASRSATPKTWVSVLNIVAGGLLGLYVAYAARRPADPERSAANTARMRKLAGAPGIRRFSSSAT